MKIFYHSDLDGKCSAAIAHSYFETDEEDKTGYKFIKINYNDPFPFDDIFPNEKIIIVDFSLKNTEQWEKLLSKTEDVLWIDHHKTAIDQFDDFDLKGIRDSSKAACVLTWEYFYPTLEVPLIVKMLGDYDIWKFEYGDDSKYLQLFCKICDTHPQSDFWGRFFRRSVLYAELDRGKDFYKFRQEMYKDAVHGWSYETEFEGYHCIACNTHEKRSQFFESIENIDSYDIMIPYCHDGKNWVISLYTNRNDIDVGEIAKKYGGGGHKGAAGFVIRELPLREKD